jgi:hypothetical protein
MNKGRGIWVDGYGEESRMEEALCGSSVVDIYIDVYIYISCNTHFLLKKFQRSFHTLGDALFVRIRNLVREIKLLGR